jgi:hypothetical protein
MKNLVRVAAVLMVVAALTAGQSMLMAAPTNGAVVAVDNSGKLSLWDTFLQIFAAVWGGGGGYSTDGAVWGCRGC